MGFKLNKNNFNFGEGTGSRSSFKKNLGPVKGKIGSEYRKKEYDARGWKYDDTIAGYNKDGTKKKQSTTNKKDTSKKDTNKNNNQDKKILKSGDIALTGQTVKEIGGSKKAKNLLKKGGKFLKYGGRAASVYGAVDIGSRLLTGKPIHKAVIDAFNPYSEDNLAKSTLKEKRRKAEGEYKKQKKYGADSYFIGRKN
jgi:hypothetical protein|tara:strand:+ start:49 stop:636 length:588 start_codon:yes stop_codon:yes gene_type:complete